MKLHFCLKEILEACKVNRRGIINEIAAHTGLERHQVTALFQNRARYLSLDTLGKICNYLIQEHKLDPQQLPGLLFRKAPDNFWELLANRHHLELVLGRRRGDDDSWVTDSDALMQATLLYGISCPGVIARKAQFLEQRLVLAPDLKTGAVDPSLAQAVYKGFEQRGGALVAVGSVKIDVVTEMIAARAFDAKEFKSQDGIRRPQDRSCPFLFAYREEDPHPDSCCGGMKLARSCPVKYPGIYYEDEDGQWTGCPWSPSQDAALVFYRFQPNSQRLEVIVGGFSGRATRWLADVLRTKAGDLWPPCYDTPELQIGAFIVRFEADSSEENTAPFTSKPRETEVIRLSEAALKRRLEK